MDFSHFWWFIWHFETLSTVASTWGLLIFLQWFTDKTTRHCCFADMHSWFCLHSWSISRCRRLIYNEKSWLFCFCQNRKCVEIWRRVFCPVPQLLLHIQPRVLCGWPCLSPLSQSWHFDRHWINLQCICYTASNKQWLALFSSSTHTSGLEPNGASEKTKWFTRLTN